MIDLSKLREAVVELFSYAYVAAHDIKHIEKVAGLCRLLAKAERYAVDEAEAAGLLHDVGRLQQADDESHAKAGLDLARKLLDAHTLFPQEAKDRILEAISQHSAKESEGELAHLLQDADKIDGLGAIGLVRAYTSKSHLVDYPDGVIVEHGSRAAQTISEQVAFQMEWYDMLYTQTAKTIAKPRYAYMKEFMLELKCEVDESK